MTAAGAGRRRLFEATALAGAGYGAVQACAFARNVIVARLLSPEHFGIAAAFAITIYCLEMGSTLAVDRLLVQAPDGDDPRLLETAHVVEIARGLASAALIFVAAAPLAALFGAPEATWAFRWLAGVPLLRAFLHLDMRRVQRELHFRAGAIAEGGAALLATLAIWPLAAIARGYDLMLWLLLVQTALLVLLSHVVAKRRFSIGWNAGMARRALVFGWPLLVNGLLLFGVSHGDRVVIGIAERLFGAPRYSLADLGIYSVAFALVQAPTLLAVQVTNGVALPLFSRAATREELLGRYALTSQIVALGAACFAVLAILCGSLLVRAVYGEAYIAAGAVIGWLGAMQAVRIVRPAPTQLTISQGDTRTLMWANVVRSGALVAVLVVAAVGGSLAQVAACGLLGEVCAHVFSLLRVRRVHGIALRGCLWPSLAAAAVAVAATAVAGALPDDAWLPRGFATVFLVAAACVGAHLLFPDLRRFAAETWARSVSGHAPERPATGTRTGGPR